MSVKPLLVVALLWTCVPSSFAQVTPAQIEVLLSRGFGTTSLDASVGEARAVGEHTLFAIASNTKAFVGDHLWFRRALTLRDVLTQVPALGEAYAFRAGYGYSNVGYVAAGEVIREVMGQSWGAFAKTRLWTPLGMTRTVASVTALEAALAPVGDDIFYDAIAARRE